MSEESEAWDGDSWCTKECIMHMFFDTCNCVGALPGGLIVGYTIYSKLNCWFDKQKHFIIPENKLLQFLKVLEDLAKEIIESTKKNQRQTVDLKDGTVTSSVSGI